MGKCLVTKLKSVVSNNLPKLGELLINVTNLNSSNKKLKLRATTENLTLRVLDGTNRLKCSDIGYNTYVNTMTVTPNNNEV